MQNRTARSFSNSHPKRHLSCCYDRGRVAWEVTESCIVLILTEEQTGRAEKLLTPARHHRLLPGSRVGTPPTGTSNPRGWGTGRKRRWFMSDGYRLLMPWRGYSGSFNTQMCRPFCPSPLTGQWGQPQEASGPPLPLYNLFKE